MDVRTRRLLRRQEVLDLVQFSLTTLYRLMANGDFPRPVKLGARAVAWWEDEVLEWMEQRPRSTGYTNRKRNASLRS